MDYGSLLRENRFAIFLLHGVIEQQNHRVRNYNRKHLERDYFIGFLKQLQAAGGVAVSMDQIWRSAESGETLPPKSFAITFDDGFLNNLTIAAPVLADMAIPACFYVTSDFIDSNRMSWIDRIEWAIEKSDSGTLSFPWGSSGFSDDDSKRNVLAEIRKHVKADRQLVPDVVASAVQQQLGFAETWSSQDPLDQKMNWDEVKTLNAGPGFVVGGHSHSHAILEFLDDAALDHELDMSLAMLREKSGIGPVHYSYPEGLAHCYSDRVIAKLKDRGVKICPSAIEGDNAAGADLFHLRRFMVV